MVNKLHSVKVRLLWHSFNRVLIILTSTFTLWKLTMKRSIIGRGEASEGVSKALVKVQ
jgi:hypothetical protein